MENLNLDLDTVLNPLGGEIGRLQILLSIEKAKVAMLQEELAKAKESSAAE